ncbi:ciliated left-right organizer metallopeptidase [Pelobates fuscus]|uniref:ciliated left-right organizer metallopeptidase n=1 Tax=Pelobates fuscus TaxID=191477 RepID=UPI002FE4AF16
MQRHLSVIRTIFMQFPGWLYALSLTVITGFCSSVCIHDSVQRETVVVSPPIIPPHASHLHIRDVHRTPFLPLRITPWYLQGESVLLTPAESNKLQKAILDVTRTVSSVLSVHRVEGPLLLNRDIEKFCHSVWRNSTLPNYNKCGSLNKSYRGETCLDIIIPDSHLRGFEVWLELGQEPSVVTPDGAGIPGTDFLLYVRVAQTEKCATQSSVIAYASYCQLDPFGRPLAGIIVFCPEHLKEEGYQHSHVVQVSLHELLHALGFSRNLFSRWIDCDLYDIGDICSSRSRVANTDENGQFRIYTPTVMRKMGEHLGGGRVGAPLENKDFPHSASSHWEARVLQGSTLTASLSPPHLTHLDIITLAAFKDMGWYGVNTNIIDQLVWGKGAGHSFGLPTKCNDTSTGFFCTGSEIGCHHLHLDKGVCSTDSFLEGCRIYKPLSSGGECWLPQKERAQEQIYDQNSRCFFSNLTKEGARQTKVKGRCYLHRCMAPNSFQVKVQGSEWTDCPPGEWIQVAGFDGFLHCPLGRLCMGFNHLLLPVSTGSSPLVSTAAVKEETKFISGPKLNVQVIIAKSMKGRPEETMQLKEEVLVVIAQKAGIRRCLLQGTPRTDLVFSFFITTVGSEDCPGHNLDTPSHLALLKLACSGTPSIMYNSSQFSTVLIRILDHSCPTLNPNVDTNTYLTWACLGALFPIIFILMLAWKRHKKQSLIVHDIYQSQVVDEEDIPKQQKGTPWCRCMA